MALEIYSYTEASALLEGSHFAGAGLYQLTNPIPYMKTWILGVWQDIFFPL